MQCLLVLLIYYYLLVWSRLCDMILLHISLFSLESNSGIPKQQSSRVQSSGCVTSSGEMLGTPSPIPPKPSVSSICYNIQLVGRKIRSQGQPMADFSSGTSQKNLSGQFGPAFKIPVGIRQHFCQIMADMMLHL